MTRKMVIFVDYENTRLGGEDAFSRTEPANGAARALCLTELAKAIRRLSHTRRPGRRIEVHEVRAYRGYFPNDRGRKRLRNQCTCVQCSAHAREERHVREGRPLVKLWKEERSKGDNPNKLKEKGIDSSLALDFAEAVYEGSYDDIFVIVSSDKDVLSVLEHEPVKGIINDVASPLIQIAGWRPDIPNDKIYELAKKKNDDDPASAPARAWLTVENCGRNHAGVSALSLNYRDYKNIAVD